MWPSHRRAAVRRRRCSTQPDRSQLADGEVPSHQRHPWCNVALSQTLPTGRSSHLQHRPLKHENPLARGGFRSSGGRIRTCDLRVMRCPKYGPVIWPLFARSFFGCLGLLLGDLEPRNEQIRTEPRALAGSLELLVADLETARIRMLYVMPRKLGALPVERLQP
jgi:hypothetical protein